ncbi:hypothetical protein FRC01_007466 [Tulasnella sp. 417]|nr:hypothetical protein FRC01_007466 [Tulasnella sp. 417]
MSGLEESREQIAKTERQLMLLESQVAHYRSLTHQVTTLASKINDRILDLGTLLEGFDSEHRRVQERILSCVENEDDDGVLAGKDLLVKLASDLQMLVDSQIAMNEMREVAAQAAGSAERKGAEASKAFWKLFGDLRALRVQYTLMGGNLDEL